MTTPSQPASVDVTQEDRNLVKLILGETTHTAIGYKIDRDLAFTAEVEAAARHRLASLAPARCDRPAVSEQAGEGCVGTMDAKRAIYFLERFKRDEKMLGPHEQWALDFTIRVLSTSPTPSAVSRDKVVEANLEAQRQTIEACAKIVDAVRKRTCVVPGLALDLYFKDVARDIRALRPNEALALAQPAAGWKLVPVEPTPEMVEAGNTILDFTRLAPETWSAMLAAVEPKL